MKNRKSLKMRRFHHRRPSKMLTTQEVEQIQTLYKQNRSIKKTAKLTGFSRLTIRKYLTGKLRAKQGFLEKNAGLIRQWFMQCEGHCVPLQRKIAEQAHKTVHLRSLQRFCEPMRKEIKACLGTIRYETAPGQHLQIDFAERDVEVSGHPVRLHFFVATLAFSRRIFVKAYPAENQAAWLDGIESAFAFFGGIPVALVCDNSKCLVTEHKSRGETRLTAGFRNFCDYWKVRPIASTPYHPQCKGKVERSVRYVKENALVGKCFRSIEQVNLWLEQWSLTVADNRHMELFKGTLDTPKERFCLEANELRPFDRPRIAKVRSETRHVDGNGLVRIDNAYYRLPDAVKNTDVQILIDDNTIVVSRRGLFVMELDKAQQVYQPKQQTAEQAVELRPLPQVQDIYNRNFLQRPLAVYGEAVGGNWK